MYLRQMYIKSVITMELMALDFYGILCIPKAEGKYPAIYYVPGAGVRSYNGAITEAEKGFITFASWHSWNSVNLTGPIYNSLRAGALQDYNVYNLDNKKILITTIKYIWVVSGELI